MERTTDDIKSIKHIELNDCTGCGTCSEVCALKCITMEYNAEGFLHPKLDLNRCVECGRCLNVCPMEENNALFHFQPREYYCAIAKNKEMLLKSSSGGVFGILAEHFLSINGYVCGCVFDSKKKMPKHILTSDPDLVKRMFGSKYAQSYTASCYSSIKSLLEQGIPVLFTGTACQVAGLRNYLKKEYANLLLVEILCHGVSSPKLMSSFIQYLEKKKHITIDNIQFRDKGKLGWGSEHRTSIAYKGTNGECKKEYLLLPSYFSAFFYGLSLRSSCYNCKFARRERVADITIGDFWGAWKKFKQEFPQGISVISVNTIRGKEAIDVVESKFAKLDLLTEKEAVYSNDNLSHPVKRPQERDNFYDHFIRNGYKGIWKATYFTKTYREKTIVSLYGALIPKFIQKIVKRRNR